MPLLSAYLKCTRGLQTKMSAADLRPLFAQMPEPDQALTEAAQALVGVRVRKYFEGYGRGDEKEEEGLKGSHGCGIYDGKVARVGLKAVGRGKGKKSIASTGKFRTNFSVEFEDGDDGWILLDQLTGHTRLDEKTPDGKAWVSGSVILPDCDQEPHVVETVRVRAKFYGMDLAGPKDDDLGDDELCRRYAIVLEEHEQDLLLHNFLNHPLKALKAKSPPPAACALAVLCPVLLTECMVRPGLQQAAGDHPPLPRVASAISLRARSSLRSTHLSAWRQEDQGQTQPRHRPCSLLPLLLSPTLSRQLARQPCSRSHKPLARRPTRCPRS